MSIIKIKRSSSSAAPSTLAQGELAYSWGSGDANNNGQRLFIGTGTETGGAAANIEVIGGSYYTTLVEDRLEAAPGTLTANNAIIVDANSKIDVLNVDNITINENTVSSTTGDLVLDSFSGLIDFSGDRLTNLGTPTANTDAVTKLYVDSAIGALESGSDLQISDGNGGADSVFLATETLTFTGGTGLTSTVANNSVTFDLDDTTVAAGSYGSSTEIPVFTVDAQGRLTAANTASISTDLDIASDNGSGTVSLLTNTLTVSGGEGIDTSISNNTITISGEDATDVNKGIASFSNTHFTVTTGNVEANEFTIGSTNLNLGGLTTTLAGLTDVTIDTINVANGTISTATGDIVIDPNSGTIDAGTSTISNVVNPTQDQDAATKNYVDTEIANSANNITNFVENLSANTILNISGDSGSDAVNLANDILAFSGDNTAISTAVTDNTLTITLDDTTVSAASYGGADTVATFTVDAQGRLTAAANVTIDIASTQVNDFAEAVQDVVGAFAQGTAAQGITVEYSDAANTITFSASDASAAQKGVASFNSTNFTVTSGAVAANDLTIGTTAFTIGESTDTLEGLVSVEVGDLTISGSTITSANNGITLNPGGGDVSVSSTKITNLATPTLNTDAATKEYVDTIASASLHYHDPVRVETPSTEGSLDATYNNGTSGVGATLTANNNEVLVIDGITLDLNDRVLVYNQTDPVENGIYSVTTLGVAGTTAWVLTRTTDTDSYAPSDPDALGTGDAFFVTEGNTGAGELYVMTTEGTIDFGNTAITFSQIGASQIYSAGAALELDGVTFNVRVDDSSIEIASNALQVKALGITNDMLAGSIANSKLVNSTISFGAESGGAADPVALGETITFAAGEGINTAVSENTITISGEDAGYTGINKGIASFSNTDFVVASGAVSLNAESIHEIVNGLLFAGEGIDLTYDDGLGRLTIDAEFATSSNPGVAAFSTSNFAVNANTAVVTITAIDGGTY